MSARKGPCLFDRSRDVGMTVRVRIATRIGLREEIAADEEALREGTAQVRVAVLGDRALSVGVSARPTEPYLDRARAEGLPVVRRSTGGSGVIHRPGDLVWSIVLPRHHPGVGRDFVRGYGRLGEGAVRWLESVPLGSAWSDPPGLSSECCLLSDRGRVLTVGQKVLGGAAQHLVPSALLHQGVILSSLDRGLVARVFGLSAEDARRLTSLAELGVTAAPTTIVEPLAAALRAALEGLGRSP